MPDNTVAEFSPSSFILRLPRPRKERSGRLGLAAFALLLLLFGAQAAPGVQLSHPQAALSAVALPDGGVQYSADPDLTITAQHHFLTDDGTNVATEIVEADRFYNAGFIGRNSSTANIEAGHLWGDSGGHVALQHVPASNFVHHPDAAGEIDRHATWTAHVIGGRTITQTRRSGISPATDLRSGAIATRWNNLPAPPLSGSFEVTANSFYEPYVSPVTGFGAVDAINSSWGFTDATGTEHLTVTLDGLARANPETTFVVSAGNSGPSTGTVGGAGSGYNGITVGASRRSLDSEGNEQYIHVADFSSRGPQDYFDPQTGLVSGVRAPVDIVAPGNGLTLAQYGGATGGNGGNPNPTFAQDQFDPGRVGTSFSSPIVTGGVALMKGASRDLGLGSEARDTRVVKAVMLNAAFKTVGWDNGQALDGGVIRTTQALDYAAGAGGLDLDTTFDQYLSGQTDIAGTVGGVTNEVVGWDFAAVGLGQTVDTLIDVDLEGGSTFAATLTWFRERTSIDATTSQDNGFADLNLQVWDADFSTLIAESASLYNSVEHLYFELPSDGKYGLRVEHAGNHFGSQSATDFGLAWSGVALPQAPNDSVISVATPVPLDLGEAVVGSTPAAGLTLDKTGTEATTFAVSTGAGLTHNADGSIEGGAQSETFQLQLTADAAGSGTAGAKSLSVTVSNTASTSAAPGQGADDPDEVFDVLASVLDRSEASFGDTIDLDTLDLDFGSVLQGSTPADLSFDIFNLLGTPGFTASLDLLAVTGSGDTDVLATNLTSFDGLPPGGGQSFFASLDTGSVGTFSATYTLGVADDQDVFGAGAGAPLVLNLTGSVVAGSDLLVPEPGTAWLLAGFLGLPAVARRRRRLTAA